MAKRKDKPERMAISVPSSIRRKIANLAREQGKSQSAIVQDTLRFLGTKPGELMRVPQESGFNQAQLNPARLNAGRAKKTPLNGLGNSTVPGRITINLSGEVAARVHSLAAKRGLSKNSIVLSALEESFVAKSTRRAIIIIENRDDVIRYSRTIIDALQEALDYDSARQHNRPPPDLRLDDPAYLRDLKDLITELSRLNDLLEKRKPPLRATERVIAGLARHFDTFLASYAKSLGLGAAGLTIGAMAALLYKAGVTKEVIDVIWGHKPT